MHLAHFVQEDGAAIGLFEFAQLLAVGAGKRAGLIAKQFAFQQFVGNGGAIDFHERLVATWRFGMDHARDDFFAGAAFSADQDGGSGIGNLLNGGLDFDHLGAGAKQHAEVGLAAHLLAQVGDFAVEALVVEHLTDANIKFLGVDWLADIIVGPQPGSPEDCFRITVGGKNHHWERGLHLLETLEHIAAGTIDGQIQQSQLRIEGAEYPQGLLAGGDHIHFKPAPGEMRSQIFGHCNIIVDDQHAGLCGHSGLRGRVFFKSPLSLTGLWHD